MTGNMPTRKPRYPRVGELSHDARHSLKIDRLHSEVAVTWADGGHEEIYCGDNWCTGWCGLPALVADGARPGEVRKASGQQVAMGPLMQELRVPWGGERRPVPPEHRDDFLARWYT